MRHHSVPIGLFAITCGLLADAAPARAAAATWVSGTGSDAGNCPITAPCQTFAFALSKTNANGVINVLSAGDFGPVTITKSISIVSDGVEAAILSGADGAAIIIQAGAGDIVSLRGLTIDLHGTNDSGIYFGSGAALHVHNSVIRNSRYGIEFEPASGISELIVGDTVIANNTFADGIRVQPNASGSARAVLDRVRVENGSHSGIVFSGIQTTGSVTATVRDSISAGNSQIGIIAQESGSGTTTVMIDRTASVNNGSTGIYANGAAAMIRLGDSTVAGNGTALATGNSGVINSYQTNKITGSGNPNNIIPMK